MKADPNTFGIIGDSAAIQQVRALIKRIAPTDLPVMIQGPTGAGKELVAQALHTASGRPGRFVAFNVCAVADTMFEDALFGHVRGAFTGATSDTRGYLAEADRGTLFLDEISGLSLQSQAKLLRAIETRVFRPVGAREDRRSDFRVVAATNVPIEELVNSGKFREDLAHRLNGITIEIPPLRERRADIPLLVEHFIRTAAPLKNVRFNKGALGVLQRYDWPGNIRELRHVIERTIALSANNVLDSEEIRLALNSGAQRQAQMSSEDFGRRRLLSILEKCNWDTAQAASRLGVHRTTVYRRMRRLGISIPKGFIDRVGDTASTEFDPIQRKHGS